MPYIRLDIQSHYINLIQPWRGVYILRRADGQPLFAPHAARPGNRIIPQDAVEPINVSLPEYVHETSLIQDTNKTCSCERLLNRAWRSEKAKQRLMERVSYRLLRRHLSPQQLDDFRKHRRFDVVTSSGRRYRIAPNRLVEELDNDDKTIAGYCIHPVGGYPAGDVMLSQKFLLDTDEESFLTIANKHDHPTNGHYNLTNGHYNNIQVREITEEDMAIYEDMERYGAYADRADCPTCGLERNPNCEHRYHIYRLIHLHEAVCAEDGCENAGTHVADLTRMVAHCRQHALGRSDNASALAGCQNTTGRD